MKTLLSSILLFSALIALIIGNVFYVHRTVDKLCLYTDAITAFSPSESVDRLSAFWKKHKKFIALSVGHSELDDICELIIILESAHKAGNTAAIEKCKKLISDKLAGITRFERISVENIF